MKSLLDLVKALYGSKALSSTLGTRTNVVRLPSGKLQRYLSEDLNIEMASDAAAQNAYNEMKELIPEISKMNDAERLIFEGNLRRLKNKLEDSGLIQKENISSGITALESKVEQLKQKGKELEKVTGEKITLTDVLKDFTGTQKGMTILQDEGLVRATARQIMYNDIKSGKLKAPKEIEDIVTGKASGDPIDLFRKIYGEDALEQLDSLTPNLRQLRTEVDAEKLARSKFKFEPDINRPPGSVSIEEAKKAEQEFGINKPAQVSDFKAEATKRTSIDDLIDEYNANQDRLRLSDEEGGTAIGYEEFQKIKKRNEDIAKALEEKGISSKVEESPQAEIIPFRKKPTEPEGKADGGRIGFKAGSGKKVLDLILEANQKLKNKKSMETANPKTGEVTTPKEPVKVTQKYEDDIIRAANNIFPNYDDPRIAADQIVDSYAQLKFGLEDQYGLSNKQRMDLYTQAYDYVMDYNRGIITKKAKQLNQLDEFEIEGREPNAVGGRVGFAEGTRDAPSITLDSHDKAPDNMDKYPVKLGNLELGIIGAMRSGQSTPDPYVKINTADRNFTVRGKYNVPDTGISLLGDIGDIRMRNTQNINVPQYNYKENIRDVMRANPFSVGIEYAPDQNKNINLRYDDQGNVTLRGEARFAKGGLGYLMGE